MAQARRIVGETVVVAAAADTSSAMGTGGPLFPNLGQDPKTACEYLKISRVEPPDGYLGKVTNPAECDEEYLKTHFGGWKLCITPCNAYHNPVGPPLYLPISAPPVARKTEGTSGQGGSGREGELERRLAVERSLVEEARLRAKDEREAAREAAKAELELKRQEMELRIKETEAKTAAEAERERKRGEAERERERDRTAAERQREQERHDQQLAAERERADRNIREERERADRNAQMNRDYLAAQQTNQKEFTTLFVTLLTTQNKGTDPVAAMKDGMALAAQLAGGGGELQMVQEGMKTISALAGVATSENAKQLASGTSSSGTKTAPKPTSKKVDVKVKENPSKPVAEMTAEKQQRVLLKAQNVFEELSKMGKDPEEVLDGLIDGKLGLVDVELKKEGEEEESEEETTEARPGESAVARRRRKRKTRGDGGEAETAVEGDRGAHASGANGVAVAPGGEAHGAPSAA